MFGRRDDDPKANDRIAGFPLSRIRREPAPAPATTAASAVSERRNTLDETYHALTPIVLSAVDADMLARRSRGELARLIGDMVVKHVKAQGQQINLLEQRDLVTCLLNDLLATKNEATTPATSAAPVAGPAPAPALVATSQAPVQERPAPRPEQVVTVERVDRVERALLLLGGERVRSPVELERSAPLLLRFEQLAGPVREARRPRFVGGDLLELTGIVLENASQWARAKVQVKCSAQDGEASFVVEDDGPGMEDNEIAKLGVRGTRLDQDSQGEGLGLSIAFQIVHLNRGSMTMDRGRLGGLKVSMRLPLSRKP